MKKYIKLYLDTFCPNYEFETPLCEICGKVMNDIHHLDNKGMGGSKKKDHPVLLMALCRYHHDQYGDKAQWYDFLIGLHLAFIQRKLRKIPNDWLLKLTEHFPQFDFDAFRSKPF